MNPYPPGGAPVNQTLAIVSMVLGITSIVLCLGLTGPPALITGIMAKKKVAQFPGQYGGEGFALAGIITGIVGSVILLLVVLYFVIVFGVVGLALLSQ